MMLDLVKPSCPHRHNANGTHESICTVCLARIAKVQDEREVDRLESARVCEPVNLHRARQGGSHWKGLRYSCLRRGDPADSENGTRAF